ncbi:curved DNA-binding protein [Ascobolus immersus RN42]|uniref:Curved DNA-binding protein n=1 Tax=Ascobolus immersus RN42 TaxID=1160509 RepID=A0A3N4IQB1_ASCIM|nr:curved DNA-binding protein [Ascobolus immersus RN42]
MADTKEQSKEIDYSLENPDTLTRYKDAASVAHKVLAALEKEATEGKTVIDICKSGDAQLEDEITKVYKSNKKISKGLSMPTTISLDDVVTPLSPLESETAEAQTPLKNGQLAKLLVGAHIDGFAAIAGSTVVVGASDVIEGEAADLILAAHYINEAFLRLIIPPTVNTTGAEKAEGKPITPGKLNNVLEKIADAYGVKLVESTTSYQFERNEIEAKKRLLLAPGEGVKGEGIPEIGEVWGIEVAVTTGSGKVKTLPNRPTIHKKTANTFALKRPSAKEVLSEVNKRFGTFPFSLRQLKDERTAKIGVLECVRGNIFRQYEVVGEKDGKPVARLFNTVAVTKNGVSKLAAPTIDLSKYKSDKKIEDEEILKLLETPLSKAKKSKKKASS